MLGLKHKILGHIHFVNNMMGLKLTRQTPFINTEITYIKKVTHIPGRRVKKPDSSLQKQGTCLVGVKEKREVFRLKKEAICEVRKKNKEHVVVGNICVRFYRKEMTHMYVRDFAKQKKGTSCTYALRKLIT